eukprot:scaffold17433_cov52-Cyclotella_meneghiniana.AAC.6
MRDVDHHQRVHFSILSFDLTKPLSAVSQDDSIRINADDAFLSPGETAYIQGESNRSNKK